MSKGRRIISGIALLVSACCLVRLGVAAEPTVIEIGEKVKVKDCNRFGTVFNRSADLKRPLVENFEGYTQRAFFVGELFEKGLLEKTKKGLTKERMENFQKYYVGSELCVLSGPAKGQWRKIKAFEVRKGIVTEKKGDTKEVDTAFMVFDKPIKLDESLRALEVNIYADTGFLQQKSDTSHGTLGLAGYGKLAEEAYELKHDDLPPGSKGKTVLLLKSQKDKREIRPQSSSAGGCPPCE